VFPVVPGWGSVTELKHAFCFDWPPFAPAVSIESASDELLAFTVQWRRPGAEFPAIVMVRRLAKDDDASYAFHDACFITDKLPLRQRGFATEMCADAFRFTTGSSGFAK